MHAHKFTTIPVLVLLIALTTVCAVAEDWPNWRGPQHNGISYEVDWGADSASCVPKVVWEQQVKTGFSSIAVADGRVYTMGNTNNTDKVFCLDANTGDILWTHSYPAALAPQSYDGGPSATPTVADGKVYTLSKEGMAYCLDAKDGAVKWERNLVTNYGVRAPSWGFAGSPYVHGDLVIYNAGTHGLALYVADGTLAWETGTKRSGYSTPVPFDFGQQRYLVLMGEKTFAAVEAQTGKVLWEHPWVTRYYANIPDPIVQGNLVFVSTGYQEGSALFDVATGQVTQRWFEKNMQTYLNSCVLWQGYLYGPNDKGDALTCMEHSTGDIVWTWNQARGGFGRGSLTLADGKLVALSEGGELCIAEASPAGYREIGRGRILTGTCWSVPVLANGKIYARNSKGNLVCVELETTGPDVDAGSSIITWLEAGMTTVDLTGAVTDPTGDLTSIRWSVISSPPRSAVVRIANDSAAITTATFGATGLYVLELRAIDATAQEGSDRVEVRVYADSCEAAKNNPVSPYFAPAYDFDNDCIENLSDLAMFTADWLQLENFDEFAVLAAEWLEAGDFDGFAVFATKWLEVENFNDFAAFAAEWSEDKSLTADVRHD